MRAARSDEDCRRWHAAADHGQDADNRRCRRSGPLGSFGLERLSPRPADRSASPPGRRAGHYPGMTDQATIQLRHAGAGDAEAIATPFTDEGYPPTERHRRPARRFANDDAQVVVADT